MKLAVEENTYLFSQLLNSKDDDQGTVLFVKHLFKTGQLHYVQILFPQGVKFYSNKDLPYLFASDALLEKLCVFFDTFFSLKYEYDEEELYPDVVSNATNLVGAVREFKERIVILTDDFSLPSLFECVSRFAKKSIELLKPLKGHNTGIHTNLNYFTDLLAVIRTLDLNLMSGNYFCFRKK